MSMEENNKTLREQFFDLTGLTFDIDKKIEELAEATPNEKKKYFAKIEWYIPGGNANFNGKPKIEIAKFLNELAAKLGITDFNADITGDDKVDHHDKKIQSRVEIITDNGVEPVEGEGDDNKGNDNDETPKEETVDNEDTEETKDENEDDSDKPEEDSKEEEK